MAAQTAMRLGIDFGTTRTIVAAAVSGRYPLASFETARGFTDYLPGLASFDGGELRLGWEARPGSDDGLVRALRSIKRAVSTLGPEDSVRQLDERLNALDLTTAYLDFLRRMLLERSNLELSPNEPLEAMVAVPANASSRQRYLTLEAFRRAGFRVLGMISEPTAAAIEFAQRNLGAIGQRTPKRYVVVYDLGGGTFDTSAVSLKGRRYDLIHSEGIARLGGDDFDEVIYRMALEAAKLDPRDVSDTERTWLLEMCREAKEALTPSSRKMLVDVGAVIADREPVTLEVAAVYDACQPLVESTLQMLDRVFHKLSAFGIDPHNPRELGAIYLVGGATGFPPVAKSLRQRHKRKIQLAPEPHASTAVGLAIAADPDSAIYVREAVTRHFGVWREGDGGREKVFDWIFAKDSSEPGPGSAVVTRCYRPAHAAGHLRFLEASELTAAGEPAGDITPWGDFFFPYDPALRAVADLARFTGERRDALDEQIVETYRYTADGRVEVAIENATRGYAKRFCVELRTPPAER